MRQSALPERGRPLAIALGVLTLGVAYLCIPRPNGWVLAHLHKEDGQVFLADFLAGGHLFDPYTGYLHLGPRLATATCATMFAPTEFAACVGVQSALLRGACALVALAVLLPYARRWGWALAAASTFLFAGVGQMEALGNLTNWRWFLVTVAVFGLLGNFRGPLGAVGVSLLLLAASLSDPLVVLLAPIAVWRLAGLRGWARLPGLTLAAGCGLHWALLNRGARSSTIWAMLGQPVETAQQLLVRGGLEAVYGQTGTQVLVQAVGPWVALLALALPVAALLRLRPPGDVWALTGLMVLLGMGLLLVTLSFGPTEARDFADRGAIGNLSRYALIPSLLSGSGLLVCLSWIAAPRRWLAWATAAVMVLGAGGDLRGDSWNARGPEWPATVVAARIGCADWVIVPVTPQGVPMKWDARLPCDWVARG